MQTKITKNKLLKNQRVPRQVVVNKTQSMDGAKHAPPHDEACIHLKNEKEIYG